MVGVEGELREHLPLVLPLPLEQKPAVEWLAGLEQAVRFSLASRLTDCLSRLPRPLMGQPLTTEEAILEWLNGHVQQSILLALDIHWSSRLQQACSDHTHSSLQTLQLVSTCFISTCIYILYMYIHLLKLIYLHLCSSQLQRAMENTVQLLLRHTAHQSVEAGEDTDKKALTFHVLQSVIIYLRRKSDFAHALLTSSADIDKCWQFHLHHTTKLSTDNEASSRPSSRILGGSKFSPGESKASLTASRTSLTASRTSFTASRSNLPSPKIHQLASLPGPSLATVKFHQYLSSPGVRSPASPAGSSGAASRASIHSGEHLQISSPSPCTVHAGGSSVGYGFEYYGPAPQVVMTPAMESGVISIVAAIAQYQFPGVTGEREYEPM